MMWPFRRKAATHTEPKLINGHPARPRRGDCPGCGAAETSWCLDDCDHLDPMDYR